ncbi:adenylate kinase [Candidatus Micrarchaeota archaeon CG06_land_8_20_14_3_00_50_6]|nr:MAG: adenylate kinase [Candidatus Micrarchaeota archaeon CG06_land_8_20_14_3_00_50_6]
MIIILGIPGVGKTSVLNGLKDFKLVNYGTLMLEIASREYGISGRDQIRRLSIAKQKAVQKKVAGQLSQMSRVLLDTHCMIRTPSGYLPGLPYSLLKGLTVEALVLVIAKPEEIQARRAKDAARERDNLSVDDIRAEIDMCLNYLAAYSTLAGVPAKVVMNNDGKLESAVAELKAVIAGVWQE